MIGSGGACGRARASSRRPPSDHRATDRPEIVRQNAPAAPPLHLGRAVVAAAAPAEAAVGSAIRPSIAARQQWPRRHRSRARAAAPRPGWPRLGSTIRRGRQPAALPGVAVAIRREQVGRPAEAPWVAGEPVRHTERVIGVADAAGVAGDLATVDFIEYHFGPELLGCCASPRRKRVVGSSNRLRTCSPAGTRSPHRPRRSAWAMIGASNGTHRARAAPSRSAAAAGPCPKGPRTCSAGRWVARATVSSRSSSARRSCSRASC